MPKQPRFSTMSLVPGGESSRENSSGSFQYPQLTVTNYTSWVIRVQDMMEDQDVWQAIAPAADQDIDVRKDKKARSHLLQVLPEDLLMQVAKNTTAKEVWDCLKARFIGADRLRDARMQSLKSDFDALRMQEGETLDQYAGKLAGIYVRYSSLGGTLNDATLVKKLFNTVLDRFLNLIAGIEKFYDLETMPLEQAVGRLKTFKERTRSRVPVSGRVSDGQLLLTKAEWVALSKKNGDPSSGYKNMYSADSGSRGRGGRNHGRGRGRGRHGSLQKDGVDGSVGGRRDKSHIQCFNCGKMGHYRSECRAPKKQQAAHLTQAEDVEPALLLALTKESALVPQQRQEVVFFNEEKVWPDLHLANGVTEACDTWYLDNRASNHMTGDKAKFHKLDESLTGRVKFGDAFVVQIMAKGSILFKCKNGDQWLLQEVYYIPRLCTNLVSIGQLTENGQKIIMDGNELVVYVKNPWQLLLKVKRT
jgi:hypothetical protein